jgi:hypothetical protein
VVLLTAAGMAVGLLATLLLKRRPVPAPKAAPEGGEVLAAR